MKWKSEEMLAAYQHYFDEQRHAESQKQFHTRLHAEVQQYLAEQHYRRRKAQTPSALQNHRPSSEPARRFDDEPDLAFLYRLAGE
jgi:hypothetical protein